MASEEPDEMTNREALELAREVVSQYDAMASDFAASLASGHKLLDELRTMFEACASARDSMLELRLQLTEAVIYLESAEMARKQADGNAT